jgi:hypothetical protein
MPLNSSGALSLGGATTGESVNLELGKSSTAVITMNDTDLRTLFGVPSSTISMSSGYGKSAAPPGATKGYFAGGFAPGTFLAQIDGLAYSTETTIDPAASLVQARGGPFGVSSATNGYCASGANSGGIPYAVSQVDGILFSNESAQDYVASIVQARAYGASNNSPTKGYFQGGGTSPTVSANQVQIDGILFSNSTAIDPAASVVQSRRGMIGVESDTVGYAGGGNSPTGSLQAQIDGINFSSETAVDPAAGLSSARYLAAGVKSPTTGYFSGGYRPTATRLGVIDGILFSNQTGVTLASGMVQTRGSAAGINSPSKGYIGGGNTPGPTASTQIDHIVFSNNTIVDTAAALVQARSESTGLNNAAGF